MAEARASLSISAPNEAWIQGQIASGEFASRSEVVNALIRRVRETEAVREHLIAAEQSVAERGWVTKTPRQMLDSFKEKARQDGKLTDRVTIAAADYDVRVDRGGGQGRG